MLNAETLEAYFRKVEDDGWNFKREGEKSNQWWHATYCGGQIKRDVYVILDNKMIYFQLPFPIDILPDCIAGLYRFLLRLNDKIFMAKFSIDGNNRVVLMVEQPVRNFDFSGFNDILKTLATLGNEYFNEIDILAQEPRVACLVAELAY